jgi:hypothetical protein
MMIAIPRPRVAAGSPSAYCGPKGTAKAWGEHAVSADPALLGRRRVARGRDERDRDLRDLQRPGSPSSPSAAHFRSGARRRDARRPQQCRDGRPAPGIRPRSDPAGATPGRGSRGGRLDPTCGRGPCKPVRTRRGVEHRYPACQEPPEEPPGAKAGSAARATSCTPRGALGVACSRCPGGSPSAGSPSRAGAGATSFASGAGRSSVSVAPSGARGERERAARQT